MEIIVRLRRRHDRPRFNLHEISRSFFVASPPTTKNVRNASKISDIIDMSFADSGEPPAKKRRFFTERTNGLDSSSTQESPSADEFDAPSALTLQNLDDQEDIQQAEVRNESSIPVH